MLVKHNTKLFALDFEAYLDSEGKFVVYACGIAWRTQAEGMKEFILYGNQYLTGEDLVLEFFNQLFNSYNLDRYVGYAHNLGKFDALFIISALGDKTDYEIKTTWKDRYLIKMKIKHIPSKKSFILYDSIKIIPGELEKALISFDCEVNKGILPYSFYSKDTLKYVGAKPDFKFYSKINLNEWNELPSEFNAERECINYFRKDIHGLLQLMSKFVDLMYKEYSYDVTLRPTLPGIAFDVWGILYLYYEPEKGKEIKKLRG